MNIRIDQLALAPEWRIGVVTSRFNTEITSKLEEGALARLQELGAKDSQVWNVSVPGAVEIPLAAQSLLQHGCDAVVALGAVVRGETAHFDYVCRSVERGCTQVALQTGRPVAFGVLTTDTEEQALDRVGGKHGHKGREAVEVVIEMLQLLKKLHT